MADRFVARYTGGSDPVLHETVAARWAKYFVDERTRANGHPSAVYARISDEEISRRSAEMADAAMARIGMYEKEGGGLTAELSEAKVIGWRSQKRWRADPDYELIQVDIVPR